VAGGVDFVALEIIGSQVEIVVNARISQSEFQSARHLHLVQPQIKLGFGINDRSHGKLEGV